MVKFLGSADLPGVSLKYYVFGSRRSGYGIRILRDNGECVNQYVSRRLSDVLDLACQLRRCSVFPDNLSEILEDLQYSEVLPEEKNEAPEIRAKKDKACS